MILFQLFRFFVNFFWWTPANLFLFNAFKIVISKCQPKEEKGHLHRSCSLRLQPGTRVVHDCSKKNMPSTCRKAALNCCNNCNCGQTQLIYLFPTSMQFPQQFNSIIILQSSAICNCKLCKWLWRRCASDSSGNNWETKTRKSGAPNPQKKNSFLQICVKETFSHFFRFFHINKTQRFFNI